MADISMDTALVEKESAKGGNVSGLVAQAAKQSGVSPFKMMREIMMMKRAPCHMTEHEYFEFQLYDPSLSKEQKRAFVGMDGSFKLNLKLAPPRLTQMRGFLRDKVVFTGLLRQLGLATTETQAVVAVDRRMGTMPCLRSVEDIERFLRDQARYPLFGKPVRGSRALGTVGIEGLDEAGQRLRLANGKTVALRALAEEIITDFPEGYMFQSRVVQHPDIARFAGDSVGTVRLVTVIEEDTPRVLYALWKIPAPTSMSDNYWQAGNMLCRLDAATGEVQACRTGKGLETQWLDTHPATGLPLKGFRIPNWDKVVAAALDAHAIFPVNGMLGWDIAVGPEGGIVIETNANPGHEFYQLSTGRGILSPDMQAVFDRVIARNERVTDELNRLAREKY
ncbi:sugar-transfer associated ATP-grasp domain-containing protein [Rhodovulum adriaticum]|uniref:Putative polysaccharide biosynthesis protein n=1 Tax=Rhodovulum adriaticum TaxID=35804 RepID=A0A4R2NKP4_RHOAD|nr:sugar-transfer associated ATP-grasp domain-containing protein [Rhodovulum adriaticum]MBK1635479.1 hypothetical protein [Rhodovulum adriaticum]TCP22051.1 putative polysaccharide biosynthesis protein [Rhodovulum adriaticum]